MACRFDMDQTTNHDILIQGVIENTPLGVFGKQTSLLIHLLKRLQSKYKTDNIRINVHGRCW